MGLKELLECFYGTIAYGMGLVSYEEFAEVFLDYPEGVREFASYVMRAKHDRSGITISDNKKFSTTGSFKKEGPTTVDSSYLSKLQLCMKTIADIIGNQDLNEQCKIYKVDIACKALQTMISYEFNKLKLTHQEHESIDLQKFVQQYTDLLVELLKPVNVAATKASSGYDEDLQRALAASRITFAQEQIHGAHSQSKYRAEQVDDDPELRAAIQASLAAVSAETGAGAAAADQIPVDDDVLHTPVARVCTPVDDDVLHTPVARACTPIADDVLHTPVARACTPVADYVPRTPVADYVLHAPVARASEVAARSTGHSIAVSRMTDVAPVSEVARQAPVVDLQPHRFSFIAPGMFQAAEPVTRAQALIAAVGHPDSMDHLIEDPELTRFKLIMQLERGDIYHLPVPFLEEVAAQYTPAIACCSEHVQKKRLEEIANQRRLAAAALLKIRRVGTTKVKQHLEQEQRLKNQAVTLYAAIIDAIRQNNEIDADKHKQLLQTVKTPFLEHLILDLYEDILEECNTQTQMPSMKDIIVKLDLDRRIKDKLLDLFMRVEEQKKRMASEDAQYLDLAPAP